MLAQVSSGALVGVNAIPVQVEVNTGEVGDPRVVIVGLPDMAVKESQDRVSSALMNSGYAMPKTRTTVNLAPGNLRKEGPVYDLPIALGILAATGKLKQSALADYVIGAELSLSGKVRPVRGALAMALMARDLGKVGLVLPRDSAQEAVLVTDVAVYAIDNLQQAVQFLNGELSLVPISADESLFLQPSALDCAVDFSEVRGQHAVRRAVEVAVAGGHNLLMIGPPGSGKSMIAKRIPTIMPAPSIDEFLELLGIQSAAGITLKQENRCFQRPFRAPHHTISDVGLLGGGNPPGPGEVSLSHHGVLFLDELPEFKRAALEVLRQPLEEGETTISRSMGKVTFPCSFMLVAAMNPCPCGYLGSQQRRCRCSPTQIQRYRSRVSGPLLDRVDIHIEAPALAVETMHSLEEGESSVQIRMRVAAARERQGGRLAQDSRVCGNNGAMSAKQIRRHCVLSEQQGHLLQQAMQQLSLSARAYDRILKVSRTIADLAGSESIKDAHLLEAIQYRSLDRNFFY